MKHLFIIVDCSGSIIAYGSEKVGQINNLVRNLINEVSRHGVHNIKVICYSNDAKVYWDSSKKTGFIDIPKNDFGGRSSLGKAYLIIKDYIQQKGVSLNSCVLALVSDGEATDDYKLQIKALDSDGESLRVAISIGNSYIVTEKHVTDELNSSFRGISDGESFIAKVTELSEG